MDNPVLESIKPFVDNSKHVKINYQALEELCNQIDIGEVNDWLDFAPFKIPSMNNKERTAFLTVFNAISFCYWGSPKWTIDYKNKSFKGGTWSMVASLVRGLEAGKPLLNPDYLKQMKRSELEQLLRGNTEIPLLDERLQILNELGNVVMNLYDGDFNNLFKSNDALSLLEEITSNFNSFNDYSFYKGKKVLFHKRAQLLISDINNSIKPLRNADKLTVCTDYKLPQYFRYKNVLEYSPELLSKINNGFVIERGSDEENERRTMTAWIGYEMTRILALRFPEVTPMQVNNYIWIKSQDISPNFPYELVRTTAY